VMARLTASVRSRRLVAGGALAVVVGVLVAGVVDDVQVQLRLHRSQGQVAATAALLNRTDALVSSAAASLRATDTGRAAAGRSLGQVTGEISSAQRLLSQSRTGMAARTVALVDVHSCAGGVSRSVAALQAGKQKQAVAALSSVAAACEGMLGSGDGGPVYPFDFADPDILVVKGTYYAYGTNSTDGNVQIMESTDLSHWAKAGDALPTLPSWAAPGYTWAPAVVHLKRSYVLYYTAALSGSRLPCVSVATARRPQGPFTDTTRGPLVCQRTLGGSIDPSPYLDGAGRPYLAWKSNGFGAQTAAIWAQALDPQGTALRGSGPSELLRPSRPWEGSVVEAPSMVTVNGTYDLFYSGNNWNSADYAIGVAHCAGVLGPCTTSLSGPLLGSQPNLEGPGGESVFTDAQGDLEMAFQAWLPGAVGYPHPRLLFIRPLAVTGGVPVVEPPR